MKKEKLASIFLLVVALIALVGAFLSKPIPQDINYHNFSDQRILFSVPNFCNVVSNIPFFIVGFLRLLKLIANKQILIHEHNRNAYYLFYLGVALVAFGSGFYHLFPNNQTLVWDRLPMTLAFMALFSIIITEYISVQKGKLLLIPLVLAGILSVIYWNYTESIGRGNLAYYALIQFYPIIAIPIILILFPSPYTRSNTYWLLLLTYLIAKVCEHFDSEIYNFIGFISGHSIKHLIAALGLYIVLYAFEKRELKKLAN